MEVVLQIARESTASARAVGAEFALWEIRAIEGISSAGQRRISVDGGVRVEAMAGGGGLAADRFAVGAGPRAPGALAKGEADLDGEGWNRALAGVEARVAAAGVARGLPAVRATLATLGVDGAWRYEYELRARAWAGSGGRGGCEFEAAVRVRAEIGGRRIDLTAEDTDRLIASLERVPAEPPVDRDLLPPLAGPEESPLVLLPSAAGRWAHELAHAVLENCHAGNDSGATDLRDDPLRAVWPFGYRWDDEGWPAAPLVPGGDRGHLRRASIRERARPLPSCSWIEPSEWVGVPDGSLVAGTALSGRLDPPSGTVVLELRDLARVEFGRATPIGGRAIAVIDLDRVVTRGAKGFLSKPGNFEPAQCARQGSLFEVMVGAPTLVLSNVWTTP